MAQPFGSRSYAGGKLPDRSMNANANALPFSASTFSRRGLATTGPGGAPPDFATEGVGGVSTGPKSTQTAPGAVGAGPGASSGPDTNPLNRLTEEQREEINEAVCDLSDPGYRMDVDMDREERD